MREPNLKQRTAGKSLAYSGSAYKEDAYVQFRTEIIRKKRNGGSLTGAEIRAFVNGIADDSVSNEQISAMAMAIFFQKMTFDEVSAMTIAMAKTGQIFNWPELGIDGPTTDKHSTGGVGDKVSLMLAPIVAACGVFDPMIAGRGLGHTGGTLDKLEAIPGFNVNLDVETFARTVRKIGCAIIGQTATMVPADRRFYAVRDVTETVDSVALITASILSKKIAAGPDTLVIDLKVGTGAFMQTLEDARELAASLIKTADKAGLPTECLLTDMNQVLGTTAGNSLEIIETIDYLNGAAQNERLHEVTIGLAARMLSAAGVASDLRDAAGMAKSALDTGRAREVFARMVVAQGGPTDLLDSPTKHLIQAPVIRAIYPNRNGRIAGIDVRRIGNVVVDLGGGRNVPTDRINPAVGLSACAEIGNEVGKQKPICIIHAANENDASRAEREILGSVAISNRDVPTTQAIIESIVL
jgi:thymidine phosphorylase